MAQSGSVEFNFDAAIEENKQFISKIKQVKNPDMVIHDPKFLSSIAREQNDEKTFCTNLGLTADTDISYMFMDRVNKCRDSLDIIISKIFLNLISVKKLFTHVKYKILKWVPSFYLKGGSAYNSYSKSLGFSNIDQYVPRTVDYDIVICVQKNIHLDFFIDFMIGQLELFNGILDHFDNISVKDAIAEVARNNPNNELIWILNEKIVLCVYKYIEKPEKINYNYKICLAINHEGITYLEPIVEMIFTYDNSSILIPEPIKIGDPDILHYVPDIHTLLQLSLDSYINRGLEYIKITASNKNKCMKDYYKLKYIFNTAPQDDIIEKLYGLFKYITTIINQCNNPYFILQQRGFIYMFNTININTALHIMLYNITNNIVLDKQHKIIRQELRELYPNLEAEAERVRLAEEARLEAERVRLAEEARLEAERVRLAEEARLEAERARLAEEARLEAEAEETRLAEEEATRIELARKKAREGQEEKQQKAARAEQQKELAKKQAEERANKQAKERAQKLAEEKAQKPANKLTYEKIETNIKLINQKISEIQKKLKEGIIEGTSIIIEEIDSLNKENMQFRSENPANEINNNINTTSRAITAIQEEITKFSLKNAKNTQTKPKGNGCNIM